MSRVAFEVILFFVVPFAMYATWLMATRQPVMSKESWDGSGGWLTIAGLAIVIVAFVYVGFTSRLGHDNYQPAHLENGKIVPGAIK
ncbi:DUF6111 family protein [Terrarubrum flagellatum]|uniref:DUF6111 family protein n=1 Tax=Terrirubrum flagellatum TaxID=2895980 RepID=UPI00314558AE